jgi:predicted DNA-binding protein (MmcQ/YjbR family)
VTAEDDRLVRLTEICSALPEAEREYNGQHAGFRVRRRTFAYYVDDHQGDGILGVLFKAAWGEHEALVASDPERFYRAPYLGHKGWVGLRLDRGPVDWGEVADLVTDSYLLVAPKRLAELVEAGATRPARPG